MGKNYVPISASQAVGAFVWAAIAASLAAVVPLFLLAAGEFESATTFGFLTKAMHFFMMMGYMFAAGLLLVTVIACIPFALSIVVANFFKISHWIYFVSGAIATALLIIPVLLSIPTIVPDAQELPEPTYWEQFWHTAYFILPAGAIAGLACWCYLRKHIWHSTNNFQSA